MKDVRLPKTKTLDEFNFSSAPHIPAGKLKELAEGDYIARAEPVLFIGDSGTGKTHLLSARVWSPADRRGAFGLPTATGPINELVEAEHQHMLGRGLKRLSRHDLVAIDEPSFCETDRDVTP